MSTLIYWFRNDLRLHDNPALLASCARAQAGGHALLPMVCHDPAQDLPTRWGFVRRGAQRQKFLTDTLSDLSAQLQAQGSNLWECHGAPQDALPKLAQAHQACEIVCEDICAPEEQAQVTALRAKGLQVHTHWQSSLLDPDTLPFAAKEVPDLFTAFRQAVEQAALPPPTPQAAPSQFSPPPLQQRPPAFTRHLSEAVEDSRSSFPHHTPAFQGGESAALHHLTRYFARRLVDSYKSTRNRLSGTDFSSKLSPWLASGALSARTAYAALKAYEAQHGATQDSYWLWFELLWRDHFRYLHIKHGAKLYRAKGLGNAPVPAHNPQTFARWTQGTTNEPLVDAGMRELAATGYLSNRLRQVVASYWVHDLQGDWRAGAAWFEAKLLDYDVYSNQGNWLYIAGRGTDPRGGRRFNPKKQTQDHDPHGHYRALWAKS